MQEAMPVGQVCNLKCSYCYENPMRDAGNMGGHYDIDAMIAQLDKANDKFALFGGEPLLVPLHDLERFFKFGQEKYNYNGIQTNGLEISDAHIDLFKKYNVNVGLSIDGYGSLNQPRSSIEETNKIEDNLERLLKEKIDVGLIITIHRYNAGPDILPFFLDWLRKLDRWGLKSARLHFLESHHHPALALKEEDNIEAFLNLASFEMRMLKNLRFDIFKDILSVLKNENKDVTCVWRNCDTYNTEAVQGVNGDGTRSNCGRANKDGVNWLKSDSTQKIRQLALYSTPQEDGGCKDCRFFLGCRGYCPGTALDADWRNRSEHCGTIKALFGYFEQVLLDNRIVPITMRPELKDIEKAELEGNTTIQSSHVDWWMIDGIKVHKVPVL